MVDADHTSRAQDPARLLPALIRVVARSAPAVFLIPAFFLVGGCDRGATWTELVEKGTAVRADTAIPPEERSAQAEALYREALEKLEASSGKEADRTAEMRELFNELENTLRTMGRQAELEPVLQKQIALYTRHIGGDATVTGAARENLGNLYRSQGRDREAVAEYRAALAVFEKRGRDSGAQRMRDRIQELDTGATASATPPSARAGARPADGQDPAGEGTAATAWDFFPGPDQPYSLDAAELDQYLSGPAPAFQEGVRTVSGPLAIQMNQWSGMLTSLGGEPCEIPFVPLSIRLAPLAFPADDDVEIGSLEILHVWGRGGIDLHDTSVAPDQKLSFSMGVGPIWGIVRQHDVGGDGRSQRS